MQKSHTWHIPPPQYYMAYTSSPVLHGIYFLPSTTWHIPPPHYYMAYTSSPVLHGIYLLPRTAWYILPTRSHTSPVIQRSYWPPSSRVLVSRLSTSRPPVFCHAHSPSRSLLNTRTFFRTMSSSLATWQAVKGLSPVIMVTCNMWRQR